MEIQRHKFNNILFLYIYSDVLETRIWPIRETNSIVTRNSRLHSLGFNSRVSPSILSGPALVITIPHRQTHLSGVLAGILLFPQHFEGFEMENTLLLSLHIFQTVENVFGSSRLKFIFWGPVKISFAFVDWLTKTKYL